MRSSTDKDNAIREQTAIKAIIDIFVSGKMKEFMVSNDYYVMNARKWIDAALIHGPITSGLLEGKAHEPQTGNDK